MAEATTEKKTRNRLTVTAMQDAIVGLYRTIRTSTELELEDSPAFVYTKKTVGDKTTYVVGLLRRMRQAPFITTELIEDAEHVEGVEEATALLLVKMQGLFKAHRDTLLAELDLVTTLHSGVLKGARSKIREKKT